jgi:hypothetical protein
MKKPETLTTTDGMSLMHIGGAIWLVAAEVSKTLGVVWWVNLIAACVFAFLYFVKSVREQL